MVWAINPSPLSAVIGREEMMIPKTVGTGADPVPH